MMKLSVTERSSVCVSVVLQLKHTVLGWRPITAFRFGYPGFEAVPNWEPLL